MQETTDKQLNPDVVSFIEQLSNTNDDKITTGRDLIRVNGVASNIYFVYEKIRNVVEYKEQSLFRKNAIARYLKRKLRFTRVFDPMAKELIVELTKTRYLANDTIPAKEVGEIDHILKCYIDLYAIAVTGIPTKEKDRIFEEILEMSACDIERTLVPRKREELYSDFVFSSFLARSNVSGIANYDERTFSLGLYNAVHRTLYRSDTATVKSYLFLATFPDWRESPEKLKQRAHEYAEYSKYVSSNLESKLTLNVLKKVRRSIAPYLVLRQILLSGKNGSELVAGGYGLVSQIEKVCQRQYQRTKEALANSIVRSVAFIFLTKMLLALIIEIPYDIFVVGHLSLLPLSINLIFPPAYLILVGLSTRIPDARNTKKIVHDINQLLYSDGKAQLEYEFRDGSSNSAFVPNLFNTIYALAFVTSISLVIWMLMLLSFNVVDGVIFFIFLSTVSFFGFRITNITKELVAVDQKRSFMYVFLDFLYTPFIKIGQWLSDKYARYNFLSFILDFIIEAPLKSILMIFDQWTAFIRDKKDDLI